MPTSPCCPNYLRNRGLPSILNVEVVASDHDTGECFTATFTINESGGVWRGSTSNDVGTLAVEMSCLGNQPSDVQGKLTADIGPGCQGAELAGSGADTCDLFYFSFGGNLPPECCGRPAGPQSLDVSVVIWEGPPVPNSFPVPKSPPCREILPEECCAPPGQGTGGSG